MQILTFTILQNPLAFDVGLDVEGDVAVAAEHISDGILASSAYCSFLFLSGLIHLFGKQTQNTFRRSSICAHKLLIDGRAYKLLSCSCGNAI